jgi:hypothetical protein
MPKPCRQRLPDSFRDGLINHRHSGTQNHECCSSSPSPPRQHSKTACVAICHRDARRLGLWAGRRWRRRRRARFARLRPEQWPYIVAWPVAHDGCRDDELPRQLGELIQRQLHLLRYRSRRHLRSREWRIGCSPGRQRSKQRDHDQRVRQRHRDLHAHDHVPLHSDLGWRAGRVRLRRGRCE